MWTEVNFFLELCKMQQANIRDQKYHLELMAPHCIPAWRTSVASPELTTFVTSSGDMNHRLIQTMSSMGPAIFHGGISTLLAVLILADSVSHVFQSYFKVSHVANSLLTWFSFFRPVLNFNLKGLKCKYFSSSTKSFRLLRFKWREVWAKEL